VRRGNLGYHRAVARGLYRPLGAGDVDIAAIVSTLEAAAYEGWFVLEQDTVLSEEPEAGQGPVADAEASLRYLSQGVPIASRGSGGSGVIDAGHREGRKRV
jgi:inosose dehydratase